MQDNSPAWLKSPPDGNFPSPPVDPNAQSLPFSELTWENFERLILRVVRREATTSECWAYGTKGQAQHGLDILAAQQGEPDKFACYQCKRVEKFTAHDIKKSIDVFLKGKWVKKTKRFILCTTLALSDTKQVDEISKQHERLATQGIDFEIWDASDGGPLSERLKEYPVLVDDFFLREWVHRFNGSEAGESLGERLHGAQLAELRSQLKDVYTTLFLRHDQGIRLGSQRSAPLLNRYVAPAVIETREIIISEQVSDIKTPKHEDERSPDKEMPQTPLLVHSSSIQEIRTPIGEWLSQHDKTVILGEPGYGKSTLLRIITLQLMNDRDDLFKLPWGELLPVWISFGGFSAAIQEHPNLSLEDYFDKWLHQNSVDDARPLFRRAIKQGKMVLLVDGLDEGQDVNVAKQAMDRISAFLSIRTTPAVFTSRPRGYKRVGPDEAWPIARLDSFDEEQIENFSQMWFEYLETPATKIKNEEKGYLLTAKQRTSDFLKVVRANLRVMDLARTPLFCQLLIDIFRYSHHLPEQRIKIYEKIVEMLLSDHPAARMQAAGLNHNDAPRSEDMREMLMNLALHIEEKGGTGVISTVDCKHLFCNFLTDDINGPGFSNYEAKHQAQSIIDHAQTGLGLIVERAPDELGFFHLTIQEYLAAQAMVRKDEEEQLAWLVRIWNNTRWHEVVLTWFSIRGTDQGKGATQRAIECLKDTATTPWEQLQLILLRTELAANDLGLSPREARSTIEEAADQVETSPYPDRSEWNRAALLRVLGSWQPSDDLLHTLKLALHDESLKCRRAAAESLAKIFSDDLAIGDDLATMATNWPDTAVRASAMYGLWKGWPDHEALPGLADNARYSTDMDLVLIGITIRLAKGLCDEDDRKSIWSMFVNESVSYELRGKCCEVLVLGWSKDGEFKRLAMEGLQSPHGFVRRDKEQFIFFLTYAWPNDTEVACTIAHYFSFCSPFFIHDDGFWNALSAGFRDNTEISKVLRHELLDRHEKYQAIYWGPDTKQVYCTIGDEAAKLELLEAYSTVAGNTEKYWICSALMDTWREDNKVKELLTKEFLKPPEEVAFLANWVDLFIPKKEERRNWLLEAIIKHPGRGLAISAPVSNLLHEFHDDECLQAVKTILTKDIWYYHKVDFQSKLIEIFPNDN
ncbi:MAG: NACHT domain-containing protein, partial [Halomonas sp.]|nr:NACHT domain-containing protein [Halomonas sp.]